MLRKILNSAKDCCKRWFFKFNGKECNVSIDSVFFMWKGKHSSSSDILKVIVTILAKVLFGLSFMLEFAIIMEILMLTGILSRK